MSKVNEARRKAETLKALKMQCKLWNHENPVGSEVILTLDSGDTRRTRVRHAASVLGGHTTVAWFEDVVGGYWTKKAVKA